MSLAAERSRRRGVGDGASRIGHEGGRSDIRPALDRHLKSPKRRRRPGLSARWYGKGYDAGYQKFRSSESVVIPCGVVSRRKRVAKPCVDNCSDDFVDLEQVADAAIDT